MRETEWLAYDDPRKMLEFLRGQTSDRKLRLVAVACCRRIGVGLDSGCLSLLALAEQYADGKAELGEMLRGRQQLRSLPGHTARAVVETADVGKNAVWAVQDAVDAAAWAVADAGMPAKLAKVGGAANDNWRDHRLMELHREEVAQQVGLVRHVFHPFHAYPAPGHWPSVVVELATALYEGHGDRHVLADALEEAGHQEVAEHFRNEEWHPKGCWAMDVLLGKQ